MSLLVVCQRIIHNAICISQLVFREVIGIVITIFININICSIKIIQFLSTKIVQPKRQSFAVEIV